MENRQKASLHDVSLFPQSPDVHTRPSPVASVGSCCSGVWLHLASVLALTKLMNMPPTGLFVLCVALVATGEASGNYS